MDSESSTTQSESEVRDENLNEDQREAINAGDEGTYEGNPTETFRLCRPNNSTYKNPSSWYLKLISVLEGGF